MPRPRRKTFALGPCSRCHRVVLKKGAYCRACRNEKCKEFQKRLSNEQRFCSGCRTMFTPTMQVVYAHRHRDLRGPMRKPLNWYCSFACMVKSKTKYGGQTEKEKMRKRRYREKQKLKGRESAGADRIA